MTWDFSSAGWIDGIKEFFWSLLKNVLVVAAAYATLRLTNIHISPDTKNFEVYTALVVVGRAVISGFMQWVQTIPGTVSPMATTVG